MNLDKVRHGVIERRMRLACYFALVALAMIALSLVYPAPLAVIGAMTVGQVVGTASLGFFVYAILADLGPALLRVRARAREPVAAHEAPASIPAPPPPPDEGDPR